LPLAKSRDKEKKGNKKKEEIVIFSFRKKICLLFRSPLVKKQGFLKKRRETNEKKGNKTKLLLRSFLKKNKATKATYLEKK
jgi:hypothetical protein